MKTQEPSSGRWEKFRSFGELLVKLSAFLFALAIPTSIALDNVAAGVGIAGLLILALTRALSLPPIKHLLILLVAEIPHYLFQPKRLFKSTSLKQYLASYFVGFKAGLSKGFLRKVALLLGISTTALVLSLFFEAFTGQNIKHFDPQKLHLLHYLYRPKGFLNHPLTAGGVLFVLFFFFWALYSFFRERKFLLFSAVALLGVGVNQSRSYWIGLLVFLLFLTFGSLLKGQARKLAAAGLILIVATSGVLVAVPQLKKRIESVWDVKRNESNMDRLTIWLSYYYAFKRDYGGALIYGKGDEAKGLALSHGREACLAVYPKRACQGRNYLYRLHGGETHNIYLKFLSKYGLIGLFAYLFFWGYNIYANISSFLRGRELFPLVFASGYVGFLAAGFFENNFTDAEVLTAILFVLGVNFALLSQRSDGRPPDRREG